jgi:uncharacterized protein
MKKNKTCAALAVLLAISIPSALRAGDRFRPWNPDVGIADENVDINKIINDWSKNDSNRDAAIIKRPATAQRRVYGGPQAGAFFLIRLFQIAISPQDGPNCRFNPTCSSYGRQAVEMYGAFIGAMLAGDRLIRCNPFNPPGIDTVPERLSY